MFIKDILFFVLPKKEMGSDTMTSFLPIKDSMNHVTFKKNNVTLSAML